MSLQARYGDVRVLWDVSLEVAAGELVCIIGSNGAGKTTLMRCLSGLLQPSAGSIVIRDNLLMGAYLRTDKVGIAADLERIYAMFPILAERRRQDAGTLSGGEQQMCAIGRGLMAAPRVLLIDELSLGLAPRAVELLSETLRKVNATGVAILLVEQDVMNALELANRAYVIDHGRVTKSGPAIGLASDPAICEAYMGLS
jgi:branched-chain amino acid transport system ATP-binding protein